MNTRTVFEALSLPLLATIVASAAACAAPMEDSERSSRIALGLTAPTLGTAGSFAVLGGQTVTNTGSTTIAGDLGVSPGLAITGFPPGLVIGGATHAGGAVALQAQTGVTIAYDALAAEACTDDLTGKDLGGMTLTPGVYCFADSAQLTGALVLDAGGKADAVFVFKTESTLTTASNASVQVINGGSDCNVFWKIGSSATIGTGTTFAGSVLALASITLTTGATMSGRALARTGAVTMDENVISLPTCAKPALDAGIADDAANAPDASDASDAAIGTPDAADAAVADDASTLDGGAAPVDASSSEGPDANDTL